MNNALKFKYGFHKNHLGEECNKVYYILGGLGGGLKAVIFPTIARVYIIS